MTIEEAKRNFAQFYLGRYEINSVGIGTCPISGLDCISVGVITDRFLICVPSQWYGFPVHAFVQGELFAL